MSDEHPVHYLNHNELASKLTVLHDLEDLPKLFDEGFDPVAISATLNGALGLPCLSHVSRRSKELLECLKRWALSALNPAQEGGILLPSVTCSIPGTTHSFTALECRCILANAFFGNLRDSMEDYKDHLGGLSFWKMARRHNIVSVHKIAALLQYFYSGMDLEGTCDDERVIEFCHVRGVEDIEFSNLVGHSFSRSESRILLEDESVHLHAGSMEDVIDASAFVNFANEHFGYGEFIPSCTQEEILQVCCPEFNVGMLFVGIMEEDEVVNVYNCRRFSSYTGYLNTFCCTGPVQPQQLQIQHILTLHACYEDHYTAENVLLDTRKAYTSFAALADYVCRHSTANTGNSNQQSLVSVSTGKWGCGAFGGTPSHKLLQQIVAAKLASVKLHFSTFGTPDECDLLLKALNDSRCTVNKAWDLLCSCGNQRIFDKTVGIEKYRRSPNRIS